MSDRHDFATVNEGIVDQEFTVSNSDSILAVNETLVNVKTLVKCFKEKIDRELGNFVDSESSFDRNW